MTVSRFLIGLATFCLLAVSHTTIFGQDRLCGSAAINNEVIAADPAKAALVKQLDREALEYEAEHYGRDRGVVRVIPIVFHIIHNNGTENISKEQILDAVRIINEDFRGENPDLSLIVDEFVGITADSEVEFRLAKKDPNGNCTDGITRTVSTLTFDAGENVKGLVSWNTSRYLNVWVVDKLASGAGGYAYYPGNAPSQSQEGIVVRHAQVGSIGTSGGSNFSARTLTHEIGHYLNLRHVWGNSNDNADPGNCSGDDNVSDTPNTIGSDQTCSLSQVTCGSLDNVQNYMDYSTCARMFTQGQKTRMQSALQSSAGLRNNLWTSTNLVNTGTNDGFSAPCTPNVQFSASSKLGCEGAEVEFTDESWGADEDESWVWNWSFPGGTPATSSEQNPTITYNSAGTYNVTLTITTGEGSDSETQNSLVTINNPDEANEVPFSEGIENSSFPNNTSDPELGWIRESGSSNTWQRTTTASASGSASVRINLRVIDAETLNSLISPPVDLSEVSDEDARLYFKVAHAPRSSSGSSERLRVYVSKDCGESWQIRYTRSGNSLSTVSGTVSGTFVPDANEWREEDVNISSVAGEPNVMFKFEAMSDEQNYLYLDDINIAPNHMITGLREDRASLRNVSVYPNPISGQSLLRVNVETAGNATIAVTDALGRMIGTASLPLSSGTNTVALEQIVSVDIPGIYLLTVAMEDGYAKSIRLVK